MPSSSEATPPSPSVHVVDARANLQPGFVLSDSDLALVAAVLCGLAAVTVLTRRLAKFER
ncbi:MAG TPA: hypothetical protein VID48_13030 [Solirubrobacteraceae bacterium]